MILELLLGVTLDIAQPKFDQINFEESYKEFRCLADTMYYESRGEPREGQILVGLSVLERVKDKSYPSTVCGVVDQPFAYSWTLAYTGSDPAVDNPKVFWGKTLPNVFRVLDRWSKGKSDGLTHYHSVRVHPHWADKLIPITKVGKHIFYTE